MGVLEFKTADKHSISVSLLNGNPETASLKSIKNKNPREWINWNTNFLMSEI